MEIPIPTLCSTLPLTLNCSADSLQDPPPPVKPYPPCEHTLAVHMPRMTVCICSDLFPHKRVRTRTQGSAKIISKGLFSLSERH